MTEQRKLGSMIPKKSQNVQLCQQVNVTNPQLLVKLLDVVGLLLLLEVWKISLSPLKLNFQMKEGLNLERNPKESEQRTNVNKLTKVHQKMGRNKMMN